MQYKAEELVSLLSNAHISGDPGASISGVSIDSRKISPGDLYVSIRGERHDGDTFVPQAFASGCPICIGTTSREVPVASGTAYIMVSDGLLALQELAIAHRNRFSIPVIGVTGSNGKTTVKEMIAHLLESKFRTRKSLANLNGQIGVALSVLTIEEGDEVAVLEAGISRPGEMERLVSLIKPNVTVLTNIGPVHLEFFDSEQHIVQEKGKLVQAAPREGLVIFDGDDSRLSAFITRHGAPCVRVGFSDDCDIRASMVRADESGGIRFTLEDSRHEVSLPVFLTAGGRHNVKNFLMAYCVAVFLGIPPDSVVVEGKTFTIPSMRQEIIKLSGNVMIIDDTYNASPLSMKAAIDLLTSIPRHGRRVAVLGEMLELGTNSPELHRQLGRHAVNAGVEVLLTVGQGGVWIAEGAVGFGFAGTLVKFNTRSDLEREIVELIQDGDIILVKASRGIALESIVTVLRSSREVQR